MRVARTRKTFNAAFRRDAIALLNRTDRPIRALARDLGISPSTLDGWYRSEMAKKKKTAVKGAPRVDTESETVEEKNARLERENAALKRKVDDLERDRAILKKAAAFFAKESE